MTLLEKYEQLINKANKVVWRYYYYWNNYTSPKLKKSNIIWGRVYNVIHKLKIK